VHLVGFTLRIYHDGRSSELPIGCPETLVRNYHCIVSKTPEECKSHLPRGGSLKSRILHKFFFTFNYVENKSQFIYFSPSSNMREIFSENVFLHVLSLCQSSLCVEGTSISLTSKLYFICSAGVTVEVPVPIAYLSITNRGQDDLLSVRPWQELYPSRGRTHRNSRDFMLPPSSI